MGRASMFESTSVHVHGWRGQQGCWCAFIGTLNLGTPKQPWSLVGWKTYISRLLIGIEQPCM